MDACQITSRVCFFPNRQARARGAPSFDDLAVRPCIRSDPFQKIKDQRLDGIVSVRFGVIECSLAKHLWIDNVDRTSGSKGHNLLEYVGELELELVFCHVADMGSTHHVGHVQWMLRIPQR